MIKKIFFDLDGTLLNMNLDLFIKLYISGIAKFLANKKVDNAEQISMAILNSSLKMVENDGTRTNEELFWDVFEKSTGIKKDNIEPIMVEFYEKYFIEVSPSISENSNMVKAINTLYKKGYKLYLTTNPLFPLVATLARMSWANVDSNKFEFITCFTDCHYSKPNPLFFEEIVKRFNINKDEVLVVGNDAKEDLCCKKVELLNTYLITDNLLHAEEKEEAKYLSSSKEFLEFVLKLPDIN
ncbi:MAG: HAD family hydrolase [Bacilli bacterium]